MDKFKGECSSGCGNNRTLHFGGSQETGDQGAIGFGQQYYGCGPANCSVASKRVYTPFVDGTLYSNIEVRFHYFLPNSDQNSLFALYYIDNANVMLMTASSVTDSCANGNLWSEYVYQLPAAMNYRSDIQIAF